jgi:hypothetical protein
LVEAVRTQTPPPHGATGRLAVAHHALDGACARALADYRLLLHDPAVVLDWPLDHLVTQWQAAAPDTATAWLNDVRRRYLDLSLSDEAWTKFGRAGQGTRAEAGD